MAQDRVDELDAGRHCGAGDGQRLLDRGQDRWRGGDGAAGAAVAHLHGAALSQQDPHRPGQDRTADQAGEQPRRRGLAAVVCAAGCTFTHFIILILFIAPRNWRNNDNTVKISVLSSLKRKAPIWKIRKS